MQNGNNKIWHILGKDSEVNHGLFTEQRKAFWKDMANLLTQGGF